MTEANQAAEPAAGEAEPRWWDPIVHLDGSLVVSVVSPRPGTIDLVVRSLDYDAWFGQRLRLPSATWFAAAMKLAELALHHGVTPPASGDA